MNAALGTYQVDAWLEPVTALGFSGVHWDTLGAQASSPGAEAAGVGAFVRATGPLLANHGLRQTLNQIDVAWWDRSLFDTGLLTFPYAEVWSATAQALYFGQSPRGGVVANYPGSEQNGCCCMRTSDDCSCKQYPHCPGPAPFPAQDELLRRRWTEASSRGLRYLVVGNGHQRLINEYFPITVQLTAENVAFISNATAPC